MSTGGMANVLHAIPYRSDWLNGVGLAFFFLNIVLFIFNCTMISIRFYRDPSAFKTSLANQTESLFAPAAPVSVAMILISVCQYGIPYTGEWLEHTMEIIFWIYGVTAMFISAGIYLILWSTQ
jgi:tellurite resistance protein TehA-like permease